MAIFTEVHQPKILREKELDNYLSKGWFRMGQTIFTCHFLYFDSILYSAIWIRLALKDFTFSKSLRKILRRNNNKFRTIIRKGKIDEEKENLYKLHKTRFSGYIANTIKQSLQEGKQSNIFNTYEVCVYEGEKLVAASFFDVGEKSAASIMGLFDPSYSKYSLGLYTMLAEIVFCMNKNKDFYYPGYVVPGYPSFDYKLRIGDVDYFCPYGKTWKPYIDFSLDKMLSTTLMFKLTEAEKFLSQSEISNQKMLYPLYDKKIAGYKKTAFLTSPMFILCFPEMTNRSDLIVEYDLFKKIYLLHRVIRFEDTSGYIYSIFEGYDKEKTCYDFLYMADKLMETNSLDTLQKEIKKSIKS